MNENNMGEIKNVVGRLHDESHVVASIEALTGDASGRRYYRVRSESGCDPESLVVMDFRDNLSPSDAALNRAAPKELPFSNLTRHLAAAGVRVPCIHLDASDDGFLLIEDLGDDLFFDRVSEGESIRRSWYAAAVDFLCFIHDSMWPLAPGCIAATRNYDYLLLRWELDHFREWGIEALSERPLGPDIRKQLDSAFDDLAGEIIRMEQGFVHRDFQSKNLMVLSAEPSAKNLAIIDYQDALKGPRIYDLVALLNDSYVDLTLADKVEGVHRYASQRGFNANQLVEEFHLVTIHRKLKDGARFVFFDRVKGNSAYLPFVDGSFARAKQSLDLLDGHPTLKAALRAAAPRHFDV